MADQDVEMREDEEEGVQRSSSTSAEASKGKWLIDAKEFGTPAYFNELKFPTRGDILRRVSAAYEDSVKEARKSVSYKSLAYEISKEIVDIWVKTEIPILQVQSVKHDLKQFLANYQKLDKNKKRQSFQKFKAELNTIFDIAKCSCPKNKCSCSDSDKIPTQYVEFLFDQRKERTMSLPLPTHTDERDHEFAVPQIPGPSRSSLSQVQPPGPSRSALSQVQQPGTSESALSQVQHQDDVLVETTDIETTTGLSESENIGSEWEPPSSVQTTPEKKRGLPAPRNMPNTSMECDRYKVSSVAAAAIISAFCKDAANDKDFQMVDEYHRVFVLNHMRMKRERDKTRKEQRERNSQPACIKAFSFDSKKDVVLTYKKMDDGKRHPRREPETHYTILIEPGSEHIGAVPTGAHSNAGVACDKIVEYLREKNKNLSNLMAVSCDGEAKNTGRASGIVRSLELKLTKPLHWFVCLLHFNELPFRALHLKVDASVTKGPGAMTGPISRAIESELQKPVRMTINIKYHRLN